jgi:two-component system response regulator PilR (NtrC family)
VNKKGLIESAEKGTLFLDEIGEMTPMMQVKLLRVLQERKFRRLGGVEELDTTMRVIAATNQELTKMVADGKFREDLFYRINVIPIHLPPLRDRQEDIPLLAEYFLVKYRDQMNKDVHGLAQETVALLGAYEWPGNIRELENVIERAVALEKSQTILAESLPEHIAKRVAKGPAAAGMLPESGFNLEEHVEGLEKEYITQALVRAGGVQVKAAELLGMSFRSFRYYVKKYNLK